MKKLALALCVGFLAASLVGCGEKKAAPAPSTPAAPAKGAPAPAAPVK